MRTDVVLFLDVLFSPPEKEEIFVGYFEADAWIKGENKRLSRAHRQPKRIYSFMGIHPALSATETQGRYWICEYAED